MFSLNVSWNANIKTTSKDNNFQRCPFTVESSHQWPQNSGCFNTVAILKGFFLLTLLWPRVAYRLSSNARWFYSSKGDPSGVKGLTWENDWLRFCLGHKVGFHCNFLQYQSIVSIFGIYTLTIKKLRMDFTCCHKVTVAEIGMALFEPCMAFKEGSL